MTRGVKKKIDNKILNQIDELNDLHNQIQNNTLDTKIQDDKIEKKLNKNTSGKNKDSKDINEKHNEKANEKSNDKSNEKVNEDKSILVDENMSMSNIITIKEFKAKELMHYKKLDNFFNESTKEECQMMVDIINGNHLISLRFLDWFVTRYCYLYKLSINVENKYIKQKDFNINISYKAQLKSFKKKYFDPFRRKKKFFYQCEKNELVILTTLGQLNFFRWALSYDIIKYTEENYRTIITKLSHVNTYFKKHVIENTSFSTTDENTKSTSVSGSTSISVSDSNDSKSNLSSEIDKKSISDIKNDKKTTKFKNPVVSRNIFLEL